MKTDDLKVFLFFKELVGGGLKEIASKLFQNVKTKIFHLKYSYFQPVAEAD